jgi:hypothetical protein
MITLAAWVDAYATATGVPPTARNRDFVRQLATALHTQRHSQHLAEVAALGLTDTVATLRMGPRTDDDDASAIHLVVTGHRAASGADVTLRWPEAAFERVMLAAGPGPDPTGNTTWASLDHGPRGESAWLLCDVQDLSAGARVTVLAIATIGEVREMRVQTSAGPRTLPLVAATWAH